MIFNLLALEFVAAYLKIDAPMPAKNQVNQAKISSSKPIPKTVQQWALTVVISLATITILIHVQEVLCRAWLSHPDVDRLLQSRIDLGSIGHSVDDGHRAFSNNHCHRKSPLPLVRIARQRGTLI